MQLGNVPGHHAQRRMDLAVRFAGTYQYDGLQNHRFATPLVHCLQRRAVGELLFAVRPAIPTLACALPLKILSGGAKKRKNRSMAAVH